MQVAASVVWLIIVLMKRNLKNQRILACASLVKILQINQRKNCWHTANVGPLSNIKQWLHPDSDTHCFRKYITTTANHNNWHWPIKGQLSIISCSGSSSKCVCVYSQARHSRWTSWDWGLHWIFWLSQSWNHHLLLLQLCSFPEDNYQHCHHEWFQYCGDRIWNSYHTDNVNTPMGHNHLSHMTRSSNQHCPCGHGFCKSVPWLQTHSHPL